jgi:hypothetical protein
MIEKSLPSLSLIEKPFWPGTVAHTCNPSTQEAETTGL